MSADIENYLGLFTAGNVVVPKGNDPGKIRQARIDVGKIATTKMPLEFYEDGKPVGLLTAVKYLQAFAEPAKWQLWSVEEGGRAKV